MLNTRLNHLYQLLPQYNFDCVAIIPGPTLQYLTDLTFHLAERPIVAFFEAGQAPALVAPEFECAKVHSPESWQLFPWKDEDGVEGAFEACCNALNLSKKRVGVESLVMRVKEHVLLTTFAPDVSIAPADPLITDIRVIKDAQEVSRMREAVAMVESVLQAVIPTIKTGMTEKEIAAELMVGLLKAGTETVPFEPLVQTGLTGSAPHAEAGSRKLALGDLLIIDFGARSQGYVSDITRTFSVGELSPKSRQIFDVVKEANRAGREIAGPGVECQAVDRAARKVIETAGFGQYFTHRTGHGLGLEGHEPPYIVEGNNALLQPGMAFTVEPGIYIPGLGGVRIEDDLIITDTGAESLTTFNRELITVG